MHETEPVSIGGMPVRVFSMEFSLVQCRCCGCEEPEAPRFTKYIKSEDGMVVDHEVCRCKCHGERP